MEGAGWSFLKWICSCLFASLCWCYRGKHKRMLWSEVLNFALQPSTPLFSKWREPPYMIFFICTVVLLDLLIYNMTIHTLYVVIFIIGLHTYSRRKIGSNYLRHLQLIWCLWWASQCMTYYIDVWMLFSIIVVEPCNWCDQAGLPTDYSQQNRATGWNMHTCLYHALLCCSCWEYDIFTIFAYIELSS